MQRVEGAFGLKRVDGAAHAGGFLPDRHIDADHVAVALGDQRVDGQCRLAGGMIAHDQFALAPAQRKERVDHHDPGLHGFGHKVAFDDRGGRAFDGQARLGQHRALAVQRTAQRIDDTAQERLADRDADNLAGAEDGIARLDPCGGVQKHAADPVGVQHPRKAELPALEAQHLVQPDIAQARDHGDAVGDLLDPAPVFGAWPQCRAGDDLAGAGQPVRGVRPHRSDPSGWRQGRRPSCCAG